MVPPDLQVQIQGCLAAIRQARAKDDTTAVELLCMQLDRMLDRVKQGANR